MIRQFPLSPAAVALKDQSAFGRNSLPYLTVALFILAALIGYECTFPALVFPWDDAYIVIHNAQALLSGRDVNYPGASPLTGATSVVHLAFVSALMLFFSPLTALAVSLWISALAYSLGLVRLARVNGACRVTSVLVAVLGLTVGETAFQLLNGLETGMVLAAVTWALTLLSGPERIPGRVLPALCGTLPFIRPDLLPLALLFLGLQAARHWRMRLDRADFLRRAGCDLAIACLFALPWMVWTWTGDKSVFPATINAKRFFFAQSGWPASVKADTVARGLAQFEDDLGLTTIFALFLVFTGISRAGLAFAGVLFLAYFAQFPTAVGSYGGRYLFPLLPFVLLGTVYALGQTRPLLRLGSAFVFALSLGQSLLGLSHCYAQYQTSCRSTVDNLEGVADWCNQNLPANSVLLIHDAGYISCRTRFPLVDLVGLKTPSSIAYHERLTFPSSGKDRFEAISEIALRGQVTDLVVLDGWDHDFSIVDGLKAAGWNVRPLSSKFIYKVYALRPPFVHANAKSLPLRGNKKQSV
ncbi:MAG: hypothetical protein ACRYFS_06400 [Janthinobacterium lividum]